MRPWQTEAAEEALGLFQAHHAIPFNALDSDSFRKFTKVLRSDFKVPGRKKMKSTLDALHARVEIKLQEAPVQILWPSCGRMVRPYAL